MHSHDECGGLYMVPIRSGLVCDCFIAIHKSSKSFE